MNCLYAIVHKVLADWAGGGDWGPDVVGGLPLITDGVRNCNYHLECDRVASNLRDEMPNLWETALSLEGLWFVLDEWFSAALLATINVLELRVENREPLKEAMGSNIDY